MKKTVYTLAVDNYRADITSITFPAMQTWADKIGADFHIISERKFPNYPAPCEKLQIYNLSAIHNNDWNIFLDADCLVHPDFFDPTALLQKDTVMFAAFDLAPVRFKTNEWFQRDGRHIGIGNWFAVASNWCRDLWKPLEESPEELVKNIQVTNWEHSKGMDDMHLLDDYTLSCNISRYGLKTKSLASIFNEYSNKPDRYQLTSPEDYLFHDYGIPHNQRAAILSKIASGWMSTNKS
jgi:hypothetical protein